MTNFSHSSLFRVFEGCLADWLMVNLRPHIDSAQFSNIKGSSINHHLVSLLNVIRRSIDKPGHHVNICAVDFMKAFDFISHTKVVQKLIEVVVNPTILRAICIFFVCVIAHK